MEDPLLSPIFTNKEDLPPYVCLLGCELDMLCKEVEDMAISLAGIEERRLLSEGNGWETERVRWGKIMGWEQTFNFVPEMEIWKSRGSREPSR